MSVPVTQRLHGVVRVASRITRPLAGRRFLPLWAVLRYRGRRSGREYATPIAVLPTPDGFVIAAPLGERTQWVLNVLAARRCTVVWRGEEMALDKPERIGLEEAAPAFPPLRRWILRRGRVSHFIRLRRANAA